MDWTMDWAMDWAWDWAWDWAMDWAMDWALDWALDWNYDWLAFIVAFISQVFKGSSFLEMQLFSGGQNITRGSEETPRSSRTSFLRKYITTNSSLSATSTVCDNLNLCPYHQLYFTKATPQTVFI